MSRLTVTLVTLACVSFLFSCFCLLAFLFHYLFPVFFFLQAQKICGEVEDVVGVLTPVCRGVAQVFQDLLVELRLLLVAEVEEGKEEDRQEESWEVESGVGRVKETALTWMTCG